MNNYTECHSDIEIDLKDMLFTLLKKLKPAFLAGILVALCALGYAFYQKGTIEEATYDSIVENLELSAQEIDTVKDYVNQYQILNLNIETQADYNDHSVIMKLDPGNVVQYSVQYLVDTDLNNFTEVFSDNIFTDADYSEMRNVLGLDETYYDLQQIARLNSSMIGGPTSESSETGAEMSSVAGDMLDTLLQAASDVNYSGLVTLLVFSDSLDHAEKLITIVENAFDRYSSSMVDAGVEFNIKRFADSYSQEWNYTVASAQQYYKKQLNTQIDEKATFLKTNVATLSTAQQELFNYLTSSGDEVESERLNKKIVILGFAIGVFWVLCYYAVQYLFTDTVKTANEASKLVSLPVTGMITSGKSGKSSAGVAKTEVTLAAMRTISLMEATEATAIFLFSSDSESSRNTTSGIGTVISEQNKQFEVGDALHDINAYIALKNSDLAIAIVELKKTTRKDMIEFEELCREVSVPIAGVIIIE